MPRLINNYVETGKVRLVFKSLDFLGQGSYRAALASQCVWNQSPEAYWDWHSKVFSEQRGGNWPTVDNLVQDAQDVEGVDAEALRSCLESEEYASAIQRHRSEASQMGVSATPNLVINGTVVNGNNYQRVKSLIETELNNSN
ncbi:MAG: thioredoxin domain-containing protein [Halobacteria archaeon]|nr:thioredoxin domain-containing protein [Halobacteria archaeon]